jgi:hypothetical protein
VFSARLIDWRRATQHASNAASSFGSSIALNLHVCDHESSLEHAGTRRHQYTGLTGKYDVKLQLDPDSLPLQTDSADPLPYADLLNLAIIEAVRQTVS